MPEPTSPEPTSPEPISPTIADATVAPGQGAAAPTRRLPRMVREFLATEAAGGVVVLVAALVAVAWANSPWRGGYARLWAVELGFQVGPFSLTEDLRHWINDAAMALFFFVVGLEIKREIVHGELRQFRVAALPILAAVGGMLIPASIYLAVAGGEASRGWGVPMATDIAFAVGVLALLGPRVPTALKLFLLTLAIVDDIGAIGVIAVFYSDDVALRFLLAAGVLILVMLALRRLRVVWLVPFLILGAGVWLMTLLSGVHATIAGVTLGLLAPATPLAAASTAREWAMDLGDEPSPAELGTMVKLAKDSMSTAERLEHRLHPWTSFAVVPAFALANAGVAFGSSGQGAAGLASVSVAVVLGLVLGKTIGIAGFSWMAVRVGLARLPEGTTWPMIVGVSALGGIGFTVSLFIAELAFAPGPVQDAAKVGILLASVAAALLGTLLLRRALASAR
ncbi:MAG: Na+/H+ antiporter NhaA [Acidimicrobiales bacterium]